MGAEYYHETVGITADNSVFYELVSLIAHNGEPGGGHYINWCKEANTTWTACDDGITTELNDFKDWGTHHKTQESAYLLIYRRIDRIPNGVHEPKVQETIQTPGPKRGLDESTQTDLTSNEHKRSKNGHSGNFIVRYNAPDGVILMELDVPSDRITFPKDATKGSVEIDWADNNKNILDHLIVQGGGLRRTPSIDLKRRGEEERLQILNERLEKEGKIVEKAEEDNRKEKESIEKAKEDIKRQKENNRKEKESIEKAKKEIRREKERVVKRKEDIKQEEHKKKES
ncbi:hypothetical protein N7478_007975 [Penicillium angulare]|uniref:uncharacterized protein n=1 Tax=Penicillium angulare TaxID=116970 RepID=UPI0025407491|nr:uncharacterized protein N7478_007975 [Penicillium angulare]KAJ5272850.1 hypothetical protein N7478_007975 [Penicillium angulare]